MPHAWTAEGVAIEADFTGGHLYQLAAAGCVLNDLYREAQAAAIVLDGVRVTASGAFNTETWKSTGIEYQVVIDSEANPEEIEWLLTRVDEVAEIPKALRGGTTVARAPQKPD